MVWLVTLLTFVGTLAVCGSVLYACTSDQPGIVRRLSELAEGPVVRETLVDRLKKWMENALISIGKLFPSGGISRAATMMSRAGYRGPSAILIVRGLTVLLPVALVSAVYFTRFYESNPIMILGGALVAGIAIPEMFIHWRIAVRQRRLTRGLPDALDLLVICMEAGLGIDQALLRVSQELQVVHPELSEELQLVNLERRVGKTRIEALRELVRRTGIEDIKMLVAMLAQTERFGTSVTQSLRVCSDDLRTRRRQRAEEMAAKTPVKMVPVLVLFIFPALMVVILGPAILVLMRQFINVQ